MALGLPPMRWSTAIPPAPVSGVRILGEVKSEYADLLRRPTPSSSRSCAVGSLSHQRQELVRPHQPSFTVFLPVKSVGVMGDGRTYDYVVACAPSQTSDFMTADWAELPHGLFKKCRPHHQRGAASTA